MKCIRKFFKRIDPTPRIIFLALLDFKLYYLTFVGGKTPNDSIEKYNKSDQSSRDSVNTRVTIIFNEIAHVARTTTQVNNNKLR
jgi:hypothetical protein